MRKTILFLLLLASSTSLIAGNLITLDLSNPDTDIELNEKGYWKETYNTGISTLDFGIFSVSHIPGMFGGDDVGGGMSYWDGFTYCTSGDDTNYGNGGSDGWVSEQWGCMAGGGLDAELNTVQGAPYLVGYWGYYYESEGIHSCQIDLNDGVARNAVGVWICNHPWPYYGNIGGDGFATAFSNEGDHFSLTAHGLLNGEDTGSEATLMLAEFKNGELIQPSKWQYLDLTSLGAITGVYFTMESSDADPLYGPNTAVYFCLDKLTVEEEYDARPQRPLGLQALNIGETSVTISWNEIASVASYNIYCDSIKIGSTNSLAATGSVEYTINSLSPYTSYRISVEAVASESSLSDWTTINIKTIDETAPTVPSNLQVTDVTDHSISIEWAASSDNVGVEKYTVYINGIAEKRISTTTYTFTGLEASTSYTIEVDARDESKNYSSKASINVSTLGNSGLSNTTKIVPTIYISGEVLHITTTNDENLTLFDARGICLLQAHLSKGKNTINLSSFAKGIYIAVSNTQQVKLIKK